MNGSRKYGPKWNEIEPELGFWGILFRLKPIPFEAEQNEIDNYGPLVSTITLQGALC